MICVIKIYDRNRNNCRQIHLMNSSYIPRIVIKGIKINAGTPMKT